MNTVDIGGMLCDIRRKSQVSRKDLCNGLCSERVLSEIERAETSADPLLICVLLQRLGKSIGKLGLVVEDEEFQFFDFLLKFQKEYHSGEYDKAEKRHAAYEAWFAADKGCSEDKPRNKICMQLLLMMKAKLLLHRAAALDYIEECIREAISLTMPDLMDKGLSQMYCSQIELQLICMLIDIMVERGERIEPVKNLNSMLDYMEEPGKCVDIETKIVLYPMVLICLVRTLYKMGEIKEVESLCRKGIAFLKEEKRLSYYIDFITYLLKTMDRRRKGKGNSLTDPEKKECLKLKSQLITLKNLQKQYNNCFNDKTLLFIESCKGIYRVGYMIQMERKRQGLSQEALCYGICSATTLSNIERGKTKPQHRIFKELMEKLGRKMVFYNAMICSDRFEHHEMAREIIEDIADGKYRQAGEVGLLLKSLISPKESVNKQFMLMIQILIDAEQGRIDLETKLRGLQEALRFTCKEDELNNKIPLISKNEFLILNNIASINGQLGREEVAVNLFMNMREYYQTNGVDVLFHEGSYRLILRNLASHLGNIGRHQESIKIAEEGIEICLSVGRIDLIPILLYSKAWDMDTKRRKENDDSFATVKACKNQFHQALSMAEITEDYQVIKAVKDLLSETF